MKVVTAFQKPQISNKMKSPPAIVHGTNENFLDDIDLHLDEEQGMERNSANSFRTFHSTKFIPI